MGYRSERIWMPALGGKGTNHTRSWMWIKQQFQGVEFLQGGHERKRGQATFHDSFSHCCSGFGSLGGSLGDGGFAGWR
jgi:hypothetical protein